MKIGPTYGYYLEAVGGSVCSRNWYMVRNEKTGKEYMVNEHDRVAYLLDTDQQMPECNCCCQTPLIFNRASDVKPDTVIFTKDDETGIIPITLLLHVLFQNRRFYWCKITDDCDIANKEAFMKFLPNLKYYLCSLLDKDDVSLINKFAKFCGLEELQKGVDDEETTD